jgi:malonate-semialdehyde dehydrogenase (acetylating)/methylmalonate-semialdehyde dehydrogenase
MNKRISHSMRSRSLPFYAGGQWRRSSASERLDVVNPATGEVLGSVPLCPEADVAAAVEAAQAAFPGWRRMPPQERVQYLFKMKALLEEHFEQLAILITQENGKTLTESRGEVRRAIDNIEVACGIPTLMQGYNLEDIAPGIDEIMIRQPLGVVAALTPFNFPAMIPFWFLPYAIACGNAFIVKPSEKVPLTMQRVFELFETLDLPRGIVNLVHGSRGTAEALIDHPAVRAISFVGSTPVAREVYARAAARGKRVQCQGGAKNHALVLPDADLALTTQVLAESAFGCAGQRCLAVSVVLTVGEAHRTFCKLIAERARALKVGYGLDEGVQMGPVISRESRARIEALIAQGEREGGALVVDGRNPRIPNLERGNFVRPTVLENVPAASALSHTEIFGPVLNLVPARTIDEALEILAASPYGNAASLFTGSGAAARRFRYEAPAGNLGINLGVPAPVAYFPFSGWRDSFFGVVHGQGRDAVEFYTEKKVVIERWPQPGKQ